MSRNIFGWHYPPGAEFDPRAPWNQPDQMTCWECGEDLPDLGEDPETELVDAVEQGFCSTACEYKDYLKNSPQERNGG